MADQTSAGERDRPEANPLIARAMSTRTRTRPMSKMIARILADDTDYLPLEPGIADERAALIAIEARLARRMLITAGRTDRITTTAIT